MGFSKGGNCEKIRPIGNKRCIGGYFVLSCGDVCPSYAR